MKKNAKRTALRIIIAAILVLVASTSIYLLINKNESQDSGLEKTSLRLKWIHQAQFSGYYIAQKEGAYRNAGLDVTIDPAGPNISPVQMVMSGVNDFGVIGGSELLKARAQGVPIVALATILQNDPISLVSLKEDNITTPQDLIGKRIGVTYGNGEELYREYLREHGIDKSQLKEVAALPGAGQLLSDQVDVLMAYSTSVPVQLSLRDTETNVVNLSGDSVSVYGDTLFTTEDMITNHPEKVRRFVQASLEGWRFAVENQNETVDEVMKINPSLERAAQAGYLETMAPFMGAPETLGESNAEVWDQMQEMLIRSGGIDSRVDIAQVSTNRFLR